MRRYIRCELFGQIYSIGLMLWPSSGQILTNFNRVIPCLCIRWRFSSLPVGISGESTTGFNLVLWYPSNYFSLRILHFRLRFTLCHCTCFRLLGLIWSYGIPLTISVFEFFIFGCVLRCVTVPVSDSHSKCAGLTRSRETVSTLPFIRIFMSLPLLTMTLFGPS